MTMTMSIKRTGLIVGAVALVGAAACSNKSETAADASLKSDLELVSNSQRPQVVVSPLEAGQSSAPTRAAPTHAPMRAPKPSQKPVTRVAKRPAPQPEASAPVPQRVQQEEVVRAPAPQADPTPASAPVQQAPAPSQDHRVYKTEGEIFKQMPWIRP